MVGKTLRDLLPCPTPGWSARPLPLFALAVGALACGDPAVQIEYDDLADISRVRMEQIGAETAVQVRTLFVCEGRSLCEPDSIRFELTSLGPRICTEPDETWISLDSVSTFFTCSVDRATLILDSKSSFEVPVDFIGERVPDGPLTPTFRMETVTFDLPFSDLRPLAEAELVEFAMGERTVFLPPSLGHWLSHLREKIDRNADPRAKPWDGRIFASYREERGETSLRGHLPVDDSADQGVYLSSITGRCAGRGWCRNPLLTLHFAVDSTHVSLDLSDVRFVLDSVEYTVPDIRVDKNRRHASVDADLTASDLRELLRASSVSYHIGALDATLGSEQISTLRRFQQRLDEASPRPPGS